MGERASKGAMRPPFAAFVGDSFADNGQTLWTLVARVPRNCLGVPAGLRQVIYCADPRRRGRDEVPAGSVVFQLEASPRFPDLPLHRACKQVPRLGEVFRGGMKCPISQRVFIAPTQRRRVPKSRHSVAEVPTDTPLDWRAIDSVVSARRARPKKKNSYLGNALCCSNRRRPFALRSAQISNN